MRMTCCIPSAAAVHYYNNNPRRLVSLVVRGMTGDYSWYSSAGKYMALYEEVTKPATDFTLTQPAETENPKEAPGSECPACGDRSQRGGRGNAQEGTCKTHPSQKG